MNGLSDLRRLGIGLALTAAAVAAAIGAIPHLVPTEGLRAAVKAELQAVTGVEPQFEGDSRLSLFPSAKVSFSGITLSDQGAPALTADELSAQLRLLPLLFGRVEISGLSLIRPQVLVQREADGSSNWSTMLDGMGRSLQPNSGRRVSFSEIKVIDGAVTVRDPSQQFVETIGLRELSLGWPAIAKSFGASGSIIWREQLLDLSISIADLLAALTGDRSGIKLRIAGEPINVAFEGHASHQPALKVEGNLSADAPSLRKVMDWIGEEPFPGGGFERFALKARTTITPNMVALQNVNVDLDGNTADGGLTFTFSGRTRVHGTLAAEVLDLRPYVSTARLLQGSEREWSGVPIGVDGLRSFDLDLRLSAAQVTLVSAKLGRTGLGATLRDGRFAVTLGESQAFGGVLKGSLAVAHAPAGADVKAQFQFTDVDLETCLGELFGIRRLEGRGNVGLTLDGQGGSVRALTRTLTGSATLVGQRGALVGLNVEQLLRRLERRPLSGGGEFRSGRTPFEKLAVTLKIAQGTAHVEDVSLEGSAVKLALGGSASIPARDLDLKGTASLVAATAEAFELPFVVQGSWDDPIMLPDPQSLIRRSGAAAPLLDSVRDRRTREAVRSALEQLSGEGLPKPAQLPSR